MPIQRASDGAPVVTTDERDVDVMVMTGDDGAVVIQVDTQVGTGPCRVGSTL